MSTRAKRMKKALENFGWQVEGGNKTCPDGHLSFSTGAYCCECGKRTKVEKDRRGEEQLESAIAYALGETRKLP